MEDSKVNQDERFSKFVNDPRFQKFAPNKKKVKIEKRFQSMFNDEKFKTNYTVDKYGKRIQKTSTEELKRFYEVESEDSEAEKSGSDEEKDEQRQEEIAISNELEATQEDDPECEEDLKTKLRSSAVDYARGEARLFSDSSSEEEFETDDEAEEEEEIDHNWGEVDNDAETTEDATRRLAICNMDWDRIRASDIMVLCNSFVPSGGGSILSVKIFPSEFGKQRLAEEEQFGPQELKKVSKEDSDSDEEEKPYVDDDDDVNMENLRKYQLKRLKYFYGVIECDSVETADNIYKECDGIEYESTANRVDLRFIPDDMDFNDEEVKDICTSLPNLDKYQPRTYTTTALQQAKVELTWDEGSIERKEFGSKIASGKLEDVSEQELKKFVAFSSEEEDEEDEDAKKNDPAISKYASLLEEINKEEERKNQEKLEKEYTWGIGVAEKKVKKKDKKNMTPIEQIMEKRQEKKRLRKEARLQKHKEEKSSDEEEDDIPDGIDMNDDYFAEEFANGDFEEPKPKKTKKDKKKKNRDEDTVESKELSLLIDDDEEDGRNHFSLSKIQKAENKSGKKSRKNKKKGSKDAQDVDDFEINLEDNRFNALYTSQLFNIDPSNPKYKKTKGMEKIIHKKIQKNIKE